MAGNIEKTLVLKDGFSSAFQKLIDAAEESVEAVGETEESLDDLASAAEMWQQVVTYMGQENLRTIGSLENLRDAFGYVMNEIQDNGPLAEMAYESLTRAMEKNGVKWTKAAYGMNDASLLAKHSIEDLARKGFLQYKRAADDATKASTRFGRSQSSLARRLLRLGATFFTLRKIIAMFRKTLEAAPDKIVKPFQDIQDTMRRLTMGPFLAALDAMGGPLNRLNSVLNSPAGQRFAAGLERVGYFIGQIIGGVINLGSSIMTWLGDHSQQVIIGLSIALAILAAAFVVANASALPLMLLVGALIMIFYALGAAAVEMGITVQDVLGAIGEGVGVLYAFVYNIIADIWNVIAAFAEFFGNVFNNPIAEIKALFLELGNFILGVLGSIANAIDAVFGSNLSGAVSTFLGGLQTKVQNKINDLHAQNPDRFSLDRMSKIDANVKKQEFGGKFRELGGLGGLGGGYGAQLKDINRNTGSAAKSAKSIADKLNEEDLKALIDVAEQKFISKINLSHSTPVINVNGQNTGNTEADRQALADALSRMLVEQVSAGSTYYPW